MKVGDQAKLLKKTFMQNGVFILTNSIVESVDIENEYYMCDECIQHETDDEIKRGADNYFIKNVTKIIKQVNKLKKTHLKKT